MPGEAGLMVVDLIEVHINLTTQLRGDIPKMNATKLTFAVLFSACLISSLAATEPNKKTEPNRNATVTAAPHCEVPCGIYSDQMRFAWN